MNAVFEGSQRFSVFQLCPFSSSEISPLMIFRIVDGEIPNLSMTLNILRWAKWGNVIHFLCICHYNTSESHTLTFHCTVVVIYLLQSLEHVYWIWSEGLFEEHIKTSVSTLQSNTKQCARRLNAKRLTVRRDQTRQILTYNGVSSQFAPQLPQEPPLHAFSPDLSLLPLSLSLLFRFDLNTFFLKQGLHLGRDIP